jgi:endothelin-converting enzyme/putative endopeptidase
MTRLARRSVRRATLAAPVGPLVLAWACASPPASPAVVPSSTPSAPAAGSDLRFDIGALDRRVDPCVDFYDYACGGWRATHPIPADRTRWSRYTELIAANLEKERSIVEDAARPGGAPSPSEARVGAYYSACMNEPAIEARGLAPLRDLFGRIDAIRSARDAAAVIAELHAHDVAVLFETYPSSDPHDRNQTMLWVDRGGLGLRDPAAYARDDAKSVALRAEYREHIARLFRLMGSPETDARAATERLVGLETTLARSALSAADRRRAEARDHPMTVAALGARVTALAWPAYFGALGAPPLDRVNVAEPAWLDAVNAALSAPDLAPVRDYLRIRVLRASATMLPRAIEAEVWGFSERFVRGAREMAPRSRRCLELVDRDVGDDVGRIFVARYFPDAARERVRAMALALLSAYRADIAASDWLGREGQVAATAKLDRMLLVIGASNRPRSFDGLLVTRDDAFGDAWRSRALDVSAHLADLGKPTDREKFFDALPQELDGFGSKAMNATGFTAGFLQPPVFDPRLDDAVNFGGLGSVIGHELTHLLDDEGRKYDADGNLRSWWSADDVARFEARAQCFIDEYARFHTDEGTPLDGKLTLGENLADNGGIRLSYAALRPSETGPKVDGFTPAQRFFLAWGQIRCENVTPEAARRQAETDEHSLGRWRVDGVVSNMPEFASAFGCAAGAPMAPATRCKLW